MGFRNEGAQMNRDEETAGIFEQADAVYFAGIRYFPNFETLAALCGKTRYALASGMEAVAALGVRDETALRRLEAHFTSGSAGEFVNAARYMLYKAGLLPEAPPEPEPPLLYGIWHPAAETPFQNLAGYLSWKRETTEIPAAAPLAAVCFPRTWILSEDMELIHAVMEPIEKNGLHPLPVFCDGEIASSFVKVSPHPLDDILSECGTNLAAVWSLLTGHVGNDKVADVFQAYDVPVFQTIRNYNQTVDEWKASTEGLSAMTICYGMTKPEMLGCIEPTLLACDNEGMSVCHPARFVLIGTMNPEEGELRPRILDRFGLAVQIEAERDPAVRVELLKRRERFDLDWEAFENSYLSDLEKIRMDIINARSLLPGMFMPNHLRTFIAEICAQNNVAGNRADLAIERAARAHAALRGSVEVSSDDIIAVASLALLHRMRNAQAPQMPPPSPPAEDPPENSGPEENKDLNSRRV